MRRFGMIHRARRAGITLLILGVAYTPLPGPDSHIIRHLHGEGQACVHHDYLLKLHPDEPDSGYEVVFHFPGSPVSALAPQAEDSAEGPMAPSDSADDCDIPFDDDVQMTHEGTTRLVARPGSVVSFLLSSFADARVSPVAARQGRRPMPRSFAASYPPWVTLASLLQRWAC
jgi:hypothetical protein